MDLEDDNNHADRGDEIHYPAGNREAIEVEMDEAPPIQVNLEALVEDMDEPPDNEVVLVDGINDESDEGYAIDEDESEEEEQHFDITLAASHSYMGSALSDVSGRAVLEAGWTGRVPVLAHHGTVFPGETVPMLLNHPHDAAIIADILKDKEHKLFGLLCPDETCQVVSGYGVVCEVFEAAVEAPSPAPPLAVSFKARAVHRFRLRDMPKRPLPCLLYARVRLVEIRVLPDVQLPHPLRHARLPSLDHWRRDSDLTRQDAMVSRLDAAGTPWPPFVFQIFDVTRMRATIREYFHTLGLEKMLPEEPVALSFWVASNLTVSPRDRLALFVVDNALLRLHMECRLITRGSALCCASCGAEVARRDHVFAMSSDGVHSNYTNPGGYMHDIVTVSAARNTETSGAPSAVYSWFPGYAWSVALCVCCTQHVGWRFDALRRNLRPQRFYGLCRNFVQPRDSSSSSRSPPPHAP